MPGMRVLHITGHTALCLQIRGVKNRYGATEEVGVFQMFDDGMQVVADPSSLFLTSRQAQRAGLQCRTV